MVGPNYVRPAVEQPTGFKSQPGDEAGAPIPSDWWRLYAEPELERLITSAQVSNQTLRQAVARVDEARALARVAGSYLYPTVSLDPSYSRTRYSGTRASTISGKQVARGVDVSNWTIPLDLSYEIDVWGRVRRSLEAARATAAATADDVGVVRLTVETDVAQYYYTIRALDAQIQILKDTVTAYEEQVRLLSVQLRTGLVSGIVVSQAQANLKATKARYRQTVAAYVEQVLVAYGDVEDALTDLHSFGDQVASLRDAVAESRNYLRLAQVQYRQGLVDYLLVIDAERTLLANQLSLAQAVNFQMSASIHLIKALGGGWDPSEDQSGG